MVGTQAMEDNLEINSTMLACSCSTCFSPSVGSPVNVALIFAKKELLFFLAFFFKSKGTANILAECASK